jgi:hypothetical protein
MVRSVRVSRFLLVGAFNDLKCSRHSMTLLAWAGSLNAPLWHEMLPLRPQWRQQGLPEVGDHMVPNAQTS